MTNFSAMTTADLWDELEAIDDNESNYSLMVAEAGSGGVSLGYDGYDAASAWASENPMPDYSTDRDAVLAELATRPDRDTAWQVAS